MRNYLSTVATLVLGFGLVYSAPAQAVATVDSSAYGLSADVELDLLPPLLSVTAQAGPINAVGGTAGTPYALTNTTLTAAENLDLGVTTIGFLGLRQRLNSGLLTSTAQSPNPANQSGSARAQINNLNFTLGSDASVTGTTILSLLGIRADTISSRSVVTGGATPDAIGFTRIEGLTLSGSLFTPATITAAAAGAFVNPGSNFNLLTVTALGQTVLRIILNEQVETSGPGAASISTNAIRIIFANYNLAGIGALNGNIVIGHSEARIINAAAEVPEPATWVQLIAGFALIGVVTRRSRRRQAA